MDSGGSSCLQDGYDVYYATSERRAIGNALVFYLENYNISEEDPEELDELQQLQNQIVQLQNEILELQEKISKAKEALK